MTNAQTDSQKKLLIIGIGNTLREDDGVGLHVVRRLKEGFPSKADYLEILAPDYLLAETISSYDRLIIIDALNRKIDSSFQLFEITPSKEMTPKLGFVTHVFDWEFILSVAQELFGNAPKTELLGISAQSFGFSENLSTECIRHAEQAFQFLMTYLNL